MGGMKTLLFKTCLSNATEQALEALIDRSLAVYYFGGSMPYRGSTDADRAQTLLFELWGELVCEDVLWSALAQLLDLYADDDTGVKGLTS